MVRPKGGGRTIAPPPFEYTTAVTQVYDVEQLWDYIAMSRYLDNGVRPEPVGRQRVFNQAIMDQLLAAVNECKQSGRFTVL